MSYSLYLHIPFCKKKCAYCDFPSYAGKEKFIDDYLEALKAESGYYSSLLERPRIATVYVGGGTPTMLEPGQMSSLFRTIRGDFEINDDAEITIEANPGTVTASKFKALKSSGVNRVSLGAQTFDNKLLKRLGRIHMEHEIKEAYDIARQAGFGNINLDLIFALPGESLGDWKDTLEKTVALGPEHISAYNLQIEEGTPLYEEKIDGDLILPDEDEELAMYKHAISYLKSKGYEHYEISNFAKKNYECAHNKCYWKSGEYIGIGAGAHSYLDGTRIENDPDLKIYLSKDNNRIKSEHKNSKKENMQETVFMGLRLIKGLDLKIFKDKYGINFQELYKKEVADLIEDGLITVDAKKAKLTEKGLYLANEVFKAFL